MAEYTPSDGDVRWQYVVKRMHDGATWMHADQEYTRWLAANDARVKRAAAREALDGLIADAEADIRIGAIGGDEDRIMRARAVIAAAVDYRDDEYPEETPDAH